MGWGGAYAEFNNGKPPHQYCDDDEGVISGGVSYALLSGKAQRSWAISHTVIPIGGERKVTRSKGNVIHEIDNKTRRRSTQGAPPPLIYQSMPSRRL